MISPQAGPANAAGFRESSHEHQGTPRPWFWHVCQNLVSLTWDSEAHARPPRPGDSGRSLNWSPASSTPTAQAEVHLFVDIRLYIHYMFGQFVNLRV